MIFMQKHSCSVIQGSLMTKVLDCETLVSDFEFSLGYYVHFRNKAFKKSINFVITQAIFQ